MARCPPGGHGNTEVSVGWATAAGRGATSGYTLGTTILEFRRTGDSSYPGVHYTENLSIVSETSRNSDGIRLEEPENLESRTKLFAIFSSIQLDSPGGEFSGGFREDSPDSEFRLPLIVSASDVPSYSRMYVFRNGSKCTHDLLNTTRPTDFQQTLRCFILTSSVSLSF